jgi:YbbR domain-containing protein
MRFLLRNWHLKLAALGLATVLYTGLVFAGAFSEQSVAVPITGINQPSNTFLLSGDLGTVQVRHRVARETTGAVSPDAFSAVVDLSAYDLDRPAEPQVLPVEVRPLVEGVSVVGLDRPDVTVRLDPLVVRRVPIFVDSGDIPEGLETADPRVQPDEVDARGPASAVARVDRAVARVRVDPSGIDLRDPVVLEPVDVEGQPVPHVELDPEAVTVQIDVSEVETNKTVPVRPAVSGAPAPGYELRGVEVDPQLVTLRGEPQLLPELTEVTTETLDLTGATADQEFAAALVIPEGTRLAIGDTSTATVTATIVPSMATRTFASGVICEGVSAGWACIPQQDQVSITLSGPSTTLTSLAATDVLAIVDVTGLTAGQHTVEPRIGPLPGRVTLVSVSPSAVPITLRSPSTPPPTPTPAP